MHSNSEPNEYLMRSFMRRNAFVVEFNNDDEKEEFVEEVKNLNGMFRHVDVYEITGDEEVFPQTTFMVANVPNNEVFWVDLYRRYYIKNPGNQKASDRLYKGYLAGTYVPAFIKAKSKRLPFSDEKIAM